MRALYGMAAGMALAAMGVSAAELGGKVVLKGTPPPEKKIVFDAPCGKLHTQDQFTRHYVVGPDGGLANVFVYLRQGPAGKTYPAPVEKPLLDQIDCFFIPQVMGVLTNQKFRIKNSDPLMHNIHATPRAPGNKEFNIGQPVMNQVTEKSFPAREILIRIKCDVHPWMFAYVGVMDHPYFAVTDKEGRYKLPADLPAGTYTVVAYHLKAHGSTEGVVQEVTVQENDKKEVNFTVELKPPA